MSASPSDKPRVGVLGAGQLALMLAEAGERIGVDVICAGNAGDCAGQVARIVEVDLNDRDAVRTFAATVDAVTIESENIDAHVLQGLNVFPNAHAISIAQDRLLEKQFFTQCDIAVAPFAAVDAVGGMGGALAHTGVPAILKTRRMGYDGKGQARIYSTSEASMHAAWESVGGVPCIMEGMLHFDAEVSLIAARSRAGEMVFYPLTENVHRDGILRVSTAPYCNAALQAQAETYLRRLMEALEYVGVLAVEFFVCGEALVANEMAPRVHNSGHWTIEGSTTSQFANALRAVVGMPLGSTASKPTVMLNCIGSMPPEDETARLTGLFRHDYGKEPRPGRKVGHLTFPAEETAAIAEWRRRLEALG